MRVMGDNIPEDAQWALTHESEAEERDLEQAYDTAVDAAIDAALGEVAMGVHADDRDLSAFLVYAARERSLDASLRAAGKYGRSDEHKKSIDALRALNHRMLLRETRRDVRWL